MNPPRLPPRLRLVVPCYNEAERLPREAFLAFVHATPGASVLFVDDGSRDATATVVNELAAGAAGRIEVVRLERNGGKAEAVRHGVLAALAEGSEFVGYWDADLSTPLGAVADVMSVFQQRPEVEIVTGARVQLLGRMVQRHLFRHYVGRLFATGASLALGMQIYDTQCGAKIFRAVPPVTRAFARPFRSSWAFDVEILARYIAAVGREEARSRIFELPLAAWTDVPGSKVRWWHAMRAVSDLFRIGLARVSRREP